MPVLRSSTDQESFGTWTDRGTLVVRVQDENGDWMVEVDKWGKELNRLPYPGQAWDWDEANGFALTIGLSGGLGAHRFNDQDPTAAMYLKRMAFSSARYSPENDQILVGSDGLWLYELESGSLAMLDSKTSEGVFRYNGTSLLVIRGGQVWRVPYDPEDPELKEGYRLTQPWQGIFSEPDSWIRPQVVVPSPQKYHWQ